MRPTPPAPFPTDLRSAIERRLGGDRRVRIDLDLRGHTEFERDVWAKALEIPRGEVRPYGWIAAEIGRPKAVRAVGTALGHNPVPLIVPCHRVVRTDGTIGQYSLGGPGQQADDPVRPRASTRTAWRTWPGRASGMSAPIPRTSCVSRPATTRSGSRRRTGCRFGPSRAPPRPDIAPAWRADRRPGRASLPPERP